MLELIDIEVYYGYVKALKGISLKVKEGEIVTLLGANGAGKTTTLKTISGLLKPKKGTINFIGEKITHLSPDEIVRKGIVQVPEGRQIFSTLTVYENLIIGSYMRKDRTNVKKDLEWVYNYFPILKERSSQIAGTLSGGEQQMLAIARALMARPKLLLMDEPSLGLAPIIVNEIFEIIQKINKDGVTILIVEQNARKALQLANYGYILETGNITMSGTAKDLRNNEDIKKYYLGGN